MQTRKRTPARRPDRSARPHEGSGPDSKTPDASSLDPDACYRAVRSRDSRFDGRFFTAVLTTGIYCRPICPARTPGRANVRFYRCAAAAEEAGFRPCLRCRPDAAPGTPAWNGTSATVTRGLRCLQERALHDESDALASRLGLGERQVRRLFLRHLGATPGGLLRTRRVHFARQLIDQTSLPMSEIAFAAGFASLRRFNEAIKDTFRRSPSELRAAARGGKVPARSAGPWLELRLPVKEPYDWDGMLAFLAPRAIRGVEAVRDGVYRRTFEHEGRPYRLEVRPCPDRPGLRKAAASAGTGIPRGSFVLLRVQPALTRGLAEVVRRARALFDLETDPWPVAERLSRDPLLAPFLRSRPGLRVPGAWDGFEIAVRAILGQQITVAGAATLAARIAEEFGEPAPWKEDGLARLFPAPARLADAALERTGLTRTRADAIRELSRTVVRGELLLTPAAAPEETRSRLREIPGVGPWTGEYIAMRALRDPDAFPEGDLGVRRALAREGALPSPAEAAMRAEEWRPWRAYGAIHLWMSGTRPSLGAKRPVRKEPAV